jgi:hypothetical protein
MGDRTPNIDPSLQGFLPPPAGFWETFHRGLGYTPGLMGGLGKALAEEAAIQRGGDPLGQQLRIAKELQRLGTAASPIGATPPLSPASEFSLMPGEGPLGVGNLPLPMQAGPPKFSVENIPPLAQIFAAPQLAPITARQASLADIAKTTAQTRQAEEMIPAIRAQTEEAGAQAAQRRAQTAAAAQQAKAGEALRSWVSEQQKSGTTRQPGFTTDLALKVTELGAPDDAVKPLIAALGLADQSRYHDAQIGLSRERIIEDRRQHQATEARLSSQFRQSLEKGDVDSARNVVNNQIQGYDRSLSDFAKYDKELSNSIETNQKIVADLIARPEARAEAAEKIKQARAEKQGITAQANVVRTQKKDAEERLGALFEETKSGKKVISRVPTEPPTLQPPPGGEKVDENDPAGIRLPGTKQLPTGSRSTGGFQASYEGRARQQMEAQVEEEAKALAVASGYNWLVPTAVKERFREQARRKLGQQ